MKHRQQRVAREVQERVAMIVEQASDPRLAGVAITGVDLSRDLSVARVWFRSFEHADQAAEALEGAAPFVRRKLAETLALRRVPELRFLLDESLERGARVESLLAELAAERGEDAERPDAGEDEEEPA